MSHEVETMAYERTQVPWHTLGNPIPEDATVDEMMIAAGLEGETIPDVLYVLRGSSYISIDNLNADNSRYRAITREKDGYVHNIATDDYNIVQNREVMEFFREYVEAGGMTLNTAGALKHGSLIWVLAKINKTFTLPGNDLSENFVLLSNSHDGSQEFNGQFTSIRVVCANTIRMAQSAKRGRSFSMRHTAKLTPEVIKLAKSHMGLAIETAEKYGELAETFANTPVSSQDTLKFVAELVQPELFKNETAIAPSNLTSLDALVEHTENKYINITDLKRVGKAILNSIQYAPGQELESAKDTAWGLLNGVTHYVDHEAGRNRDTALTSAWFGQGAAMKDKALELAKVLVNR